MSPCSPGAWGQPSLTPFPVIPGASGRPYWTTSPVQWKQEAPRNETWQGGSKEGVSAPAGLPRVGGDGVAERSVGTLWSGAGTSGQASLLGVEGASLVLNLEANHPANRKDVLPSLDQRCLSLATGLGDLPTFSRWGKWGTPKPEVLMASSAS